ncbi:hypothetical protein N7445_007832 [Penicillium cf. griseofulvum]|nr:hypothetical protein N7445_007832 [Penicillium cf. griseofulvum]
MAGFRMVVTAALAGLVPLSWAQQFTNTTMFTTYAGLSPACQEALATNVTCSPTLGVVSESNEVMTLDEVAVVCVDGCYASLESARTVIAAACKLDTDVIVTGDVAYPATFIMDNYLFTYQVSCRTDRLLDGRVLRSADRVMVQPTLNTDQQCSDCWLGGLALQPCNTLGYEDSLATNFASFISSCNATVYSYTTPTPYAINATATATPTAVTTTAAPDCTGAYTVQATDDCNSVAQALKVSTYSLLHSNGLDLYCQNFAAAVNSSLCIPPQCSTYVWQLTDDCNSVVSGLSGVTVPQFLSWNPNFNSLCQNAVNYVGYAVCIGPPGGYLNHTTDMTRNSTSPTNITTAAAVPMNAVNGTNTNCGAWYTVVEGDTCSRVSVANEISLMDFYFLNPEINNGCTNLILGEAYCVAAVGSITTYISYPVTTPLFTVTSATFASVDTSIPTTTNDLGYIYVPTYLPTAPDTLTDCVAYRDYSNTTLSNSCIYKVSITSGYLAQLKLTKKTATTDSDSTSLCLGINATESTTVSNCNCFNQVYGYMSDDYTCADLEEDVNMTEAQLLAWNPWLAGDCDTEIYANLNTSDTRAVCIGVDTSATATTSTTVAAPTPSDTIAGCQEFYTVVSGDDCSTIETKFAVTLAELYPWNPSIGSTCTNLWLEEAYCVKGPATATTTIATTTTTTSVVPTQTGIVSNCDKYHTIVAGDSCANIESLYSITFAELYEWNPAIGSNCESLWVGYAVCVGVSS